MKSTFRASVIWAVFLCLYSSPLSAATAELYEELAARVQSLQLQLAEVQQALAQYREESVTDVDIVELRNEIISAAEWKDPNTLVHMAGYADVGYGDSEGDDGSFSVGSFNPIFHFQYRDLVMLESELELEVEDDGETELALEYLTIDLIANDYVAVIGGKFLSPIGQFRQNLHPSWINKMASEPPGFGHDGAAPISEMGIQLRGGFPLGNMFANYSAYVGNGPELNSETEDGTEFELEGIVAEAFGEDRDGKKVFGGRFGLLPIPGLEIGISGVTGKAAVTQLEDEATETTMGLSDEPTRDYDVYGFDLAWQYRGFDVRGEYVKTKVGSAAGGTTPSPGADWETWYAQVAYQFAPTKLQGVIRYADFSSAHDSESQKQWGIGINYLLAGNVITKLMYEFNDGENGEENDDNRLLIQLAYGF